MVSLRASDAVTGDSGETVQTPNDGRSKPNDATMHPDAPTVQI